MAERGTSGRTDRLLVAEVLLVGIFVVLLFALYLIPAITRPPYQPGAWRWVTLAVPFFGALYLETRRRRANQRAAVREVLNGESRSAPEGEAEGDDVDPLAGEPPIR